MTGRDDDGDDRRPEPELIDTVEVEPSAVVVPLDQARAARQRERSGADQLDGEDQADGDRPAKLALVDGQVDASPAPRPPAAPRPVLPAWVKSWPAFVDAASWWLRHA